MSKDDYPTRDGRFQGKKHTCRICGLMVRRVDAVWQRGGLVHRDTCWDDTGNNPMGQKDSR